MTVRILADGLGEHRLHVLCEQTDVGGCGGACGWMSICFRVCACSPVEPHTLQSLDHPQCITDGGHVRLERGIRRFGERLARDALGHGDRAGRHIQRGLTDLAVDGYQVTGGLGARATRVDGQCSTSVTTRVENGGLTYGEIAVDRYVGDVTAGATGGGTSCARHGILLFVLACLARLVMSR